MKRLTFFIGLLLTCNNLVAQKTVTENYSTNGISDVYIKLKFAKNIEVKNWNKNDVQVVAEVSLNENTDNEKFTLKEDRIGGTLKINSDYGDLFSKHNNSNVIINGDCDSYNYCRNHTKIEANYTIYVPKKVGLEIKSISGSIKADALKNDVEFDLVSGNIDVKKHSQKMLLKTVSGDIDVVVTDAEFKAQTVTGNVYSDLDIDFDKNKNKGYSNKIYGTVAEGTAKLKLKTVSGDVLLRKQ